MRKCIDCDYPISEDSCINICCFCFEDYCNENDLDKDEELNKIINA